jgi:hypothetical protein
MIFATVAVLVIGYIPLTALNHLHLHIDRGLEFIHDHLHIGHHEHGRHNTDSHQDTRHDDADEEPLQPSSVVTFALGAQVRPPAVEIQAVRAAVEERPWIATDHDVRTVALHPSWDSRAPPA